MVFFWLCNIELQVYNLESFIQSEPATKSRQRILFFLSQKKLLYIFTFYVIVTIIVDLILNEL